MCWIKEGFESWNSTINWILYAELFKMVCEDDADTNIRIPAVMLPIDAGETLEDLLFNNSKGKIYLLFSTSIGIHVWLY